MFGTCVFIFYFFFDIAVIDSKSSHRQPYYAQRSLRTLSDINDNDESVDVDRRHVGPINFHSLS